LCTQLDVGAIVFAIWMEVQDAPKIRIFESADGGGGIVDILTIDELDNWLATQSRLPATISGVDLTVRKLEIAAVDLAGCTLLGCALDDDILAQARAQGGSVITAARGLPFNPARSTLYTIGDLYDRYNPVDSLASWKASFDYLAYLWFMDPNEKLPLKLDTGQTMQARIHDTAIEAAVARFIDRIGKPLVGFMGGHDTPRDAPVFATIADLGRRMARSGQLVLTGGGPGLMEAANLGAFLAPFPDDTLGAAVTELSAAPRYDHPDWLSVAWKLRQRLLSGRAVSPDSVSLGIPTWLYGHEPPNVFATHQAKMFYNSLREDGLITLAGGGLIIGPGNAGTVQEVFQDATQNYYRKAGVAPTPIALLGQAFWSRPENDGPDPIGRTKPLKPLLMALAGEKPKTDWSSAVLITDDVDAIAELILPTAEKALVAEGPTRGEVWRARLSA
jgi:predicted Rossmann-fold nucleotide-binding protein